MTVLEKKPSSKRPKETEVQSSANQAISSTVTYAGPIPPPQFLVQYEQMVPGIAKRFLEEPHLEAEHRRSIERRVVEERIKLSRRGQWMAFSLACITICGAFSSILLGYKIAGLGALFISVASLIGVFIYARKQPS